MSAHRTLNQLVNARLDTTAQQAPYSKHKSRQGQDSTRTLASTKRLSVSLELTILTLLKLSAPPATREGSALRTR